MKRKRVVSVEDKAKVSNILSRNPRITEVLELIFNDPETKKGGIPLNFWDSHKNLISQEEEGYYEFDFLYMSVLDYIYKRNGPTLSSVSRSIYCYLTQITLPAENPNAVINYLGFVKAIREFSSFNSTKGENVLIDALIKSLCLGHFGLSQFLVKFGLVEFPSEANEKSRKIVRKLVEWFNSVCSRNIPEEERIYIQFDNLFNQMEQNTNANFRRLIFILCYICIVAEYRASGNSGMSFNEKMKFHYLRKLQCLQLFIETTTETFITFNDVDKYLSTILNQQLKEEVRASLLGYAQKIFCENPDSYKPRPLKNLVRSKIRESLRNSKTLPAEVHQLPLPLALKEFITFEEKDIWKDLKIDQTAFSLTNTIINRVLHSLNFIYQL